ncbi:MAG: hypothetical protein ABSF99_01360 [Anaerolineales bacterium]|jgi:hypothetical protein
MSIARRKPSNEIISLRDAITGIRILILMADFGYGHRDAGMLTAPFFSHSPHPIPSQLFRDE